MSARSVLSKVGLTSDQVRKAWTQVTLYPKVEDLPPLRKGVKSYNPLCPCCLRRAKLNRDRHERFVAKRRATK